MDLLLVALVALAMIILAVRRRQRRRPPTNGSRPNNGGWSFSRHPREDWRYWRDLAILIGLVLALLAATALLTSTSPS
ncbi:hypothetical protein LV476_04475 [Guyparkeria hydrothermalis]|uniref:hypothetical protein n=1 Tax=Guyparkeria hydrothermalis TaxID=923 RepID=UPI00202181D9|nr:hypothetical protein [Guyparkeria hydrothermalis]MCL7744209.1 hypothetical protein [Guyparkeria hydrothermalis]